METGSVVISKAGGDIGKIYLVVGRDEKGYALLVDGKRHKLSAPKRKNVRHIADTGRTVSVPKMDAAVVTAIRRLDLRQ